MKLAWICYDEYNNAVIKFTEPERYLYRVIVPIVYTEIIEHEAD